MSFSNLLRAVLTTSSELEDESWADRVMAVGGSPWWYVGILGGCANFQPSDFVFGSEYAIKGDSVGWHH